MAIGFPISRDPPEGGTSLRDTIRRLDQRFPISRDPPEGGTEQSQQALANIASRLFPISRDPPEGGTSLLKEHGWPLEEEEFPISRDPPEGGTFGDTKIEEGDYVLVNVSNF